TEDMLAACLAAFPTSDGVIAAAAPSDYRPLKVADQKIHKTGEPVLLQLVETPDVVALLGAVRKHQWMVGFALETEDLRMRAMQKLERKNCDLIVANGPAAINASHTSVEVLDRQGEVVAACSGSKAAVAKAIVRLILDRFTNADGVPRDA
ncbi:MAG: phosphopantothenoylcysteine decarboxylase, partial [Patescibacteria group bacterium]|nr:phosphopantothenoylcysteine decarboxylase [Patescibacteria group bacterium]